MSEPTKRSSRYPKNRSRARSTPKSASDLSAIIKTAVVNSSIKPLDSPATSTTLGKILWDAYSQRWKKVDPSSFLAYQITFQLAPSWPRELDWLLNLAALGALLRGADRVIND